MLPPFLAVLAALAPLSLAGPRTTVHRLDDGGVFSLSPDSTYSLCYGTRCQLGTVLSVVDSIATLDISDCVDHSTTVRTTCRGFDMLADQVYFGHDGDECDHGGDSLACPDLVEARQLIPGDFGYIHGDEYDTARFERAISDSGRAADSARGWIPESPARHPCKVGSVWMLCPDRPAAAKPIQLVTRAAVVPTSCSSYACRLED